MHGIKSLNHIVASGNIGFIYAIEMGDVKIISSQKF